MTGEVVTPIYISPMEDRKTYQGVDCVFYDHLEIYASKQTWVSIKMADQIHITKVKNLQTRDKSEYAILLDDQMVRLDEIADIRPVDTRSDRIGIILDVIDFFQLANRRLLEALVKQEENIPDDIVSLIGQIWQELDLWYLRIVERVPMSHHVTSIPPQDWIQKHQSALVSLSKMIQTNDLSQTVGHEGGLGQGYSLTIEDVIMHISYDACTRRDTISSQLARRGIHVGLIDYAHYRRQKN